MKKLLLLMMALLPATMAWAEVGDLFVSEGIRYSILNESEVELRCFEEYPIGSVTIPAFVSHEGKEYAVVYIGNLSCADCAALTTVNFAEGSQLRGVASLVPWKEKDNHSHFKKNIGYWITTARKTVY